MNNFNLQLTTNAKYSKYSNHLNCLNYSNYSNLTVNDGRSCNNQIIKHNNTTCNNCGKQGHLFHQCKLPIISYGVIVFRYHEDKLQFLMIRRKDSFGYIDLMRGKYTPNNVEHIQNIINEMSVFEKQQIVHESFENLYKLMWGKNNLHKSEELNSQKKFELLKSGVSSENGIITFQTLVENSHTEWKETEWEFPKGRRNHQEKDIDCALREFSEETGYLKTDIGIVENIVPFEEIFIGSNYKSYKHKYYLARMDNHVNNETPLQNYQKSEVSKIAWKTCDECIESIRPYNLEKKQLITNINTMLLNYRLY